MLDGIRIPVHPAISVTSDGLDALQKTSMRHTDAVLGVGLMAGRAPEESTYLGCKGVMHAGRVATSRALPFAVIMDAVVRWDSEGSAEVVDLEGLWPCLPFPDSANCFAESPPIVSVWRAMDPVITSLSTTDRARLI